MRVGFEVQSFLVCLLCRYKASSIFTAKCLQVLQEDKNQQERDIVKDFGGFLFISCPHFLRMAARILIVEALTLELETRF